MNLTQIKKALKYAQIIGMTPNLVGKHGIGKTEIVRQFAKENNMKLIEFRAGQAADAGDIVGLADFETDNNGKKIATTFIPPSFLPREENTILFLDEINRSTKDILQALFELVYDKKVANYKLPKNTFIITACNPDTKDYSVLNFSDKAFQDRFVHIKVEPTIEEWLSYGKNSKFNDKILNFIKNHPTMLENRGESFDLSYVTPSRRSWEFCSKFVNAIDDTSDVDIMAEFIVGIVGVNAALSFNDFYKNYKEDVLTGKQIFENFKQYEDKLRKLSDNEVSVFGKINDELLEILKEYDKNSTLINRQNAENIVDYIAFLPKDLMVAFIKSFYIVAPEATLNVVDENGEEDEGFFLYNEKLSQLLEKCLA